MRKNKFKKVFNIKNCTIEELDSILQFYRKRAMEGCHYKLKYITEKLFTNCYKTSRLDSHYPQNNYCLLALADVSSKLTHRSNIYSNETADEIYDCLIKLHEHYFEVYSNKDKLIPNAVLAVSLLERLVTLVDFEDKKEVHNLKKIVDRLFEKDFRTLEIKDHIADEVFNENILLIANDPYALTGFDMFAIDVPRNDIVLDIFRTNLTTTEYKYVKRKKKN